MKLYQKALSLELFPPEPPPDGWRRRDKGRCHPRSTVSGMPSSLKEGKKMRDEKWGRASGQRLHGWEGTERRGLRRRGEGEREAPHRRAKNDEQILILSSNCESLAFLSV